MRNLVKFFFVIAIAAGIIFGGHWLGTKISTLRPPNAGVEFLNGGHGGEEHDHEETPFRTLFGDDRWLNITSIEPNGDKYVIKGVIYEDYKLTVDEVNAVKAGRSITLDGLDFLFVLDEQGKYSAENNTNSESSMSFGIEMSSDGAWRVRKLAASGEYYRETGEYREVEIDANVPYTLWWFYGGGDPWEGMPITIAELRGELSVDGEGLPYVENFHNIIVQDGVIVELFGRYGGI